MNLKTLSQVREAAADAPWTAYFLGCLLLCVLGFVVLVTCRLLGGLIRYLVTLTKTGFRSATLASCLVLALALAGCNRIVFAWQGPSPEFIASDIDADHELSREEWERWYGTSALQEAVLEFDWGDCNGNGRLTWEEYFRVRFKHSHCGTAPLETLSLQAQVAPDEAGLPIFSAREVELAQVSLVRNRQRLIARKFHEGYSERNMAPGTLYLYKLSCSSLESLELPETSQDFRQISRIAMLHADVYPAIRCTVSNRSGDTVTYLRLRLTMQLAEGPAETFHGKTLWIPAQASRDFWILPEPDRPVADVVLLAVRLQE